MAVCCRAARLDDESFLRDALYHALFVPDGATPLPRSILQEPEISRYVDGWTISDLTVIAENIDDCQPVGAAWLRVFTVEKPGYGFVREGVPELTVSVLPDWRGQGIGTQMLELLLLQATDQFSAVSLSVTESNPVIRLYRRLSFREVARSGSSLTMLWEPNNGELTVGC